MDNSIILFDGVCNLCDGWVQFVLKRDSRRRFIFAQLQSNPAHKLLERLGRTTPRQDSIILIDELGVHEKSSAILRIFASLDGIWKLISALRVFPQSFRDSVYDLVARNRYNWFGKKQNCPLPNPNFMERFLK